LNEPNNKRRHVVNEENESQVEDTSNQVGKASLGETIGAKLEEMKQTYAWLACRVGVARSTVRAWVNNCSVPGEAHLRGLSDALGVPFELLWAQSGMLLDGRAKWMRVLEAVCIFERGLEVAQAKLERRLVSAQIRTEEPLDDVCRQLAEAKNSLERMLSGVGRQFAEIKNALGKMFVELNQEPQEVQTELSAGKPSEPQVEPEADFISGAV
jgi:transcriptional regulator with XRE-family HTH domain